MIFSSTSGPLATMSVSQLIAAMREFRGRLLGLVGDLDERQLIGPRLAIVNPPLWEIGHVAWFQEFWALRHLRGERPILEHGDRLYNSTDVAHDTRWELLLPIRADTLAYMNEVLESCIARIDGKSVVVSSPAVPAPVAVRYAWTNSPQATLHDSYSLPVPPFRSDDW